MNATEPKPPLELPSCPTWLGRVAQTEYRRIGEQLVALGVLTAIDGAILTLLCQSWATWVDAHAHLRREGRVLKGFGGKYTNPYLGIANKAQDQIVKACAELGLTPASRSRIHVSPGAGRSEGAAARFFEGA